MAFLILTSMPFSSYHKTLATDQWAIYFSHENRFKLAVVAGNVQTMHCPFIWEQVTLNYKL